MNILSVFGWGIRIGGHFKSALAHMKCLEKMGHHLHVLMPGGESAADVVQEFVDSGVEIHLFAKSPNRGRLPSYRGVADIVRICNIKNIDVIHSHDFTSFPSSYAAALKMGKGVIFTKPGGPVNNLFPPRTVNAIFYSQELIKGMVKKYNLDPGNITLIRARIDTKIYKPVQTDTEFITKYQLPQTGCKIVIATRLEENKKLLIYSILKFAEWAAEKKMPIQIVIVGEGPLLDEIRSHSCAIGNDKLIGRIVYFKGPMFKISDINKLYNYADIVLGNGRGILEAMACAKPVVILNEMGAVEAVCHENIKDVAFFNFSGRHIRNDGQPHSSLHTVLRALIDDGEMRKRFGQYLYGYIKQNMDAEIGAKQLLGVYERSLYKPMRIIDLISWNLKITYTILGLAVQRRVRRLKQKSTQS